MGGAFIRALSTWPEAIVRKLDVGNYLPPPIDQPGVLMGTDVPGDQALVSADTSNHDTSAGSDVSDVSADTSYQDTSPVHHAGFEFGVSSTTGLIAGMIAIIQFLRMRKKYPYPQPVTSSERAAYERWRRNYKLQLIGTYIAVFMVAYTIGRVVFHKPGH
jgi:hypothetical protein